MQPDPSGFLDDCEIINFRSPDVAQIAKDLAAGNVTCTAKRCFEFVCDEIRHSSDFQLNPITCRASDVLQHRTGFCYAKSHLLCALLRANEIPAGLCYQRLSVNGNSPPYCLHGLNAIYLQEIGWFRVDARGNRAGIDAQFCPPTERLAFTTLDPNEYDLPDIHISPLQAVVDCLRGHQTWEEVAQNLPDLPGV
jgi:transglutaminase-like putative cysteine protease